MKNNKVVKVAMIGAGGRSRSVHYPSLNDMDDVKMVAVCELNEVRMIEVAGEYDIPARYTNYVTMIEREKPDVVYAIMPPHHIYDLAANIMEMGVNIIIEKPPSVTTEQAKQMALLAKKNNVITGVTFQEAVCAGDPHGKGNMRKKWAGSQRGGVFFEKRSGWATPFTRARWKN